jgi:hypothetical protein
MVDERSPSAGTNIVGPELRAHFGKAVGESHQKADLTQADLAGPTQQCIARTETEPINATFTAVVAVARVLHPDMSGRLRRTDPSTE